MDWSKGFRAAYYARMVNPATWSDGNTIDILSGSINRIDSGLRESADISCIDYDRGSDKWIRLWLSARQDGDAVNIPLFTGIVSAPKRQIDGTIIETPIQCYSVLKPAQDVKLPIGYYVAKGFIGAEMVRDLLSVTPAPILVTEDSPRLSQHIIAEDNESRLSMAYKILDAIGWRIRIEGDGTIQITPNAEGISAVYSAITNDQLEPKVEDESDWFECPNVFRARSGDSVAVARDDDPESPLSTISRGREIWKEESSAQLSDNESLAGYAARKLKESQMHATKISYSRNYNPDSLVTDRVRLSYPQQKLTGDYVITSQKITFDHSASTAEEVKAV